MSNTLFILMITLGFIILIAGIIFLVISPVKTKSRIVASNNLDPTINKLLKMFGGDFSFLIPDKAMAQRVKYTGLQRLFTMSDNPWKITYVEFVLLQFILGFVGLLAGIVGMALMTYIGATAVGIIVLIALPFAGFNYPTSAYKVAAKDREMKFKAQLPEAIDYLVMALSGGGYSLPVAFAEVIKYLQPSIIKDEFTTIVNDLDSGYPMETALQRFADRAPTEGIKAFAKSLNMANKLSVSTVEILQARATESRRDLENEIDRRIVQLESKMVICFSMPTALALGIEILAPAVATLSQAL